MIQFDCPASSNGNDKNAKNRAANHMVDTAIRKIMSDFQVIHFFKSHFFIQICIKFIFMFKLKKKRASTKI